MRRVEKEVRKERGKGHNGAVRLRSGYTLVIGWNCVEERDNKGKTIC